MSNMQTQIPKRHSSKPDFTGVWKQIKNENANDYLSAMGYSLMARTLALRFLGRSTDLVYQNGEVQEVTTLNAKGKWERMYVEGKTIDMKTADGQPVQSTAWWEKREDGTYLYKIKLEGAKQGTLETWRWIDADKSMRVKSIVHVNKGAAVKSASMIWHFEPASEDEIPPELKNAKSFDCKELQSQVGLLSGITQPTVGVSARNLGASPMVTDASTKAVSMKENSFDWLSADRFSNKIFSMGSSLEGSWMTRFNAALSITSQFDF